MPFLSIDHPPTETSSPLMSLQYWQCGRALLRMPPVQPIGKRPAFVINQHMFHPRFHHADIFNSGALDTSSCIVQHTGTDPTYSSSSAFAVLINRPHAFSTSPIHRLCFLLTQPQKTYLQFHFTAPWTLANDAPPHRFLN